VFEACRSWLPPDLKKLFDFSSIVMPPSHQQLLKMPSAKAAAAAAIHGVVRHHPAKRTDSPRTAAFCSSLSRSQNIRAAG